MSVSVTSASMPALQDRDGNMPPRELRPIGGHGIAPRITRALPPERGPLSEFLFAALSHDPRPVGAFPTPRGDARADDDLHLALYCCYELHYRGLPGVSDRWEWHPGLLSFRAALEEAFLATLLDEVGPPRSCDHLEAELEAIVAGGTGPSLSSYMAESGTLNQFREFAIHRSAYQLKEADPHSWAIPRLDGEAKAALVEIQSDEYGGGARDSMHSTLFARTMSSLGLDPRYGAYLSIIPGVTLATVNLVSFFGLHRRWRGALIGHLTVFEMASVTPNTRYGNALRRLGIGSDACAFYDVHVAADAIHERVALHRLAGGFGRAEPQRAGDVAFGARAIMAVEDRFSRHLLSSWSVGRTSLRPPGRDQPFDARRPSGWRRTASPVSGHGTG